MDNATDGLISFEINQNSIDIKPFRRSQPWYRKMDAWLAGDHQLK
jgi:hypothetical protein